MLPDVFFVFLEKVLRKAVRGSIECGQGKDIKHRENGRNIGIKKKKVATGIEKERIAERRQNRVRRASWSACIIC